MTIKQLEGRINRLCPSRLVVLARMPDGTEREMSAPEYVEAVRDGADFIRAVRDGADFIRAVRGGDLRDAAMILSTIPSVID